MKSSTTQNTASTEISAAILKVLVPRLSPYSGASVAAKDLVLHARHLSRGTRNKRGKYDLPKPQAAQAHASSGW